MTKHIANRDAREYVRKLEVFRGSNIFSEWYEQGIDGTRDIVKRYVVYSYRYNFPLFIYEPLSDTWYENSTKYSRTTTKHKTQLHPCVRTTPLCLEDMQVEKWFQGLIMHITNGFQKLHTEHHTN